MDDPKPVMICKNWKDCYRSKCPEKHPHTKNDGCELFCRPSAGPSSEAGPSVVNDGQQEDLIDYDCREALCEEIREWTIRSL